MKQWSDIKSEFVVDGSLRDIYVENTSEDIWDKFIASIKVSGYRFDFKHGDALISLPENFQGIKSLQEDNPTTLIIWVDENISTYCHFFVPSEIELDISPEDINGEGDYKTLLDFMTWLASLLSKRVHLTHENSQDMEIITIG